VRILLWHVHGGWMEAFVRGDHEYLLPVNAERDAWGLGRGGRPWPENAREVAAAALRDEDVDVLVVQRPEELAAAQELLGRRPGRELPTVYVEHNAPRPDVPQTLHPLADRDELTIAHVTHFNRLFWDTGRTPTTVVEHGVPDPGPLYSGELERLAVVVNEPVRRGRVVGTDLLPAFASAAPLDVFGMRGEALPQHLGLARERLAVHGDLPALALHERLAQRRAYVHPMRWTSLGLSLIEAMHLAMPVLVVAATEAVRAVPPEAGAISTDVDDLVRAARRLLRDPEEARRRGAAAREAALARYGLDRFLADWDRLLADVVSRHARRTPERSTA